MCVCACVVISDLGRTTCLWKERHCQGNACDFVLVCDAAGTPDAVCVWPPSPSSAISFCQTPALLHAQASVPTRGSVHAGGGAVRDLVSKVLVAVLARVVVLAPGLIIEGCRTASCQQCMRCAVVHVCMGRVILWLRRNTSRSKLDLCLVEWETAWWMQSKSHSSGFVLGNLQHMLCMLGLSPSAGVEGVARAPMFLFMRMSSTRRCRRASSLPEGGSSRLYQSWQAHKQRGR